MKPLSEPEAAFIAALIDRYDPARIITLHQFISQHQPKGCVDWDGPARELAKEMAEASGLPLQKLGARPGSLGSYAGVELQIPTITLATVYRNLNKLADLGKLIKLEVNGEYRFDAEEGWHQHCICKNCGAILDNHSKDITEKAISSFQSNVFKAESVIIQFFGLCNKCRE